MTPQLITISVEGVERRHDLDGVPTLDQLHDIVRGSIQLVPYFTAFEGHPCVAFCNEDGKNIGLKPNKTATTQWHLALRAQGRPGLFKSEANGGGLIDYLVGDIAIVVGDEEFLRQL